MAMPDPALNLVLDIGNTRVKTGLFRGAELLESRQLFHWGKREFLQALTNPSVRYLLYSTVADPLPASWLAEAGRPLEVLELTDQTALPFENTYRTPKTLGKDRLAAVAGAMELCPGQFVLVVDAGTCITYDLLTAEGTYLGGNISPGLYMRYRAMHAFTSRLPQVQAQELPSSWIGSSTTEALQNGGLWGLVWELEGFRDRARQEFGPVETILTGGDAEVLAKYVKSEIFVCPHLVLIGLNKILRHNVEGLD